MGVVKAPLCNTSVFLRHPYAGNDHRGRTDYGTFRRGGSPLGSGGMESSNQCMVVYPNPADNSISAETGKTAMNSAASSFKMPQGNALTRFHRVRCSSAHKAPTPVHPPMLHPPRPLVRSHACRIESAPCGELIPPNPPVMMRPREIWEESSHGEAKAAHHENVPLAKQSCPTAADPGRYRAGQRRGHGSRL